MKFTITRNNQNPIMRLRRLGYAPYRNKQGQESFVKRIQGNNFPRFHLYVNGEIEQLLNCSIHIDQSAPVYSKGNAHRGDYESPALTTEVDRIKKSNN